MLPGGYSVDWLAAGTYDKSVGLSLFTLQVTHKIEEDTDIERDYIVETVMTGSPEVDVEVIENFSTGYHSRNGGGDLIITDGDLPIINVRQIDVPEISTDRTHRQPGQAACADHFGAGVAIFPRTGFLAIALVLFFVLPMKTPKSLVTVEGGRPALIMAGCVVAFISLIDIGLALAVFAGRNWARILLMLSCVVTTIGAFMGNANGSEAVTLARACQQSASASWCCLPCRATERASTPYAGDTPENTLPGAPTSRLQLDLRSGASRARCGTAPSRARCSGVRQSLSWRMPRAFLPGSMIQAAHANPMSAIPSSVLRPGRS